MPRASTVLWTSWIAATIASDVNIRALAGTSPHGSHRRVRWGDSYLRKKAGHITAMTQALMPSWHFAQRVHSWAQKARGKAYEGPTLSA